MHGQQIQPRTEFNALFAFGSCTNITIEIEYYCSILTEKNHLLQNKIGIKTALLLLHFFFSFGFQECDLAKCR